MPATQWNKTRARVNSDAFNDASDCQAEMSSILPIIPVASQAERDGLAALAPNGTLPAGTTVTRLDVAGAPLQTWDGTNWQGAPVSPTTLTYPNGYGQRGSGFRVPQAYRLGGRIYLHGAISNNVTISSVAANSLFTIAYLPGNMYPSAAERHRPLFQTGPSSYVDGYLQVDSTGAVSAWFYTAQSNLAIGALTISLDGISWLDQ